MRCPAHITGLSATPTRPACPSRASGCSSLSRIGASRVACAFLVYMLPPLPRCSGWAYSTLISPSHVSLPRKGHRVGLHIVLFEACSAFTRVAACTLARSPYFVTRYPKASDISSPPCLLRLLPAGAVAGWDLHPLESAAFSRRTPIAVMGPAPPVASASISMLRASAFSPRARRGLRTIRRSIKTTALTITAPTCDLVVHAFSWRVLHLRGDNLRTKAYSI